MKVLVTGATGNLGMALVEALNPGGHSVRVLSRKEKPASLPLKWVQADLVEDHGLNEAVDGVDAIFHLASNPRISAVDIEGTRHLLKAAKRMQSRHFIYVSIVGIDEIPLKYYKSKLEAEKLVEESGVPFSILRATQFHSLVHQMLLGMARLKPVMLLPGNFRFQSVSESEVAHELMKCLNNGPQGRLPDFGGPEVLTLKEMAEPWLQAHGAKRILLPLLIPGALARSFREGKNTLSQGHKGTVTWQQWLETRNDN